MRMLRKYSIAANTMHSDKVQWDAETQRGIDGDAATQCP